MVTNQGSANASGTWYDAIYFSSSLVFDANARLLTEVANNNTVPAAGSYAWTNFALLPPVPPGTYYLYVAVDDQSRIYESTKTNNTSRAVPISVTLSNQPPIILAIQPTNQTVVAGGTATFTVVVAGTGPFTYQWLFNGTQS